MHVCNINYSKRPGHERMASNLVAKGFNHERNSRLDFLCEVHRQSLFPEQVRVASGMLMGEKLTYYGTVARL